MAREANYLWFSDIGQYYIAKTDSFGSIQYLFYPGNALLRDLTWDGEHIWMIDDKGDIWAYDSNGNLMGSIVGLLSAGWGLTYAGGPFWASDPLHHMIYELDLHLGVEDSPTEAHPGIAQLHQNYPNPFSRSTTIPFSVRGSGGAGAQGGDVSTYERINLSVFDVSGRIVKTLIDGSLPTPYSLLPTSVTWDGRDEKGRDVASGTYFSRLVAGDRVEIKSMTLIR